MIYQSAYIDPDAENWKDKIVFHTPAFEDMTTSITVLESHRLEKCTGFVFSAPSPAMRKFRDKVEKIDEQYKLGSRSEKSIAKAILDIASLCGISVVYMQDDRLNKVESFFDPLTKRRIMQKGAHYFDPSLVTLEDVEKKTKERSIRANIEKIKEDSLKLQLKKLYIEDAVKLKNHYCLIIYANANSKRSQIIDKLSHINPHISRYKNDDKIYYLAIIEDDLPEYNAKGAIIHASQRYLKRR